MHNGPSEANLKGLAGMMASAADPDFEQRAAEIKAANTQICRVCGTPFLSKEEADCPGCKQLLTDGQTALVDTRGRFAFVEFPVVGDNADLRGKVESVDVRVMDTVLARASKEG